MSKSVLTERNNEQLPCSPMLGFFSQNDFSVAHLRQAWSTHTRIDMCLAIGGVICGQIQREAMARDTHAKGARCLQVDVLSNLC